MLSIWTRTRCCLIRNIFFQMMKHKANKALRKRYNGKKKEQMALLSSPTSVWLWPFNLLKSHIFSLFAETRPQKDDRRIREDTKSKGETMQHSPTFELKLIRPEDKKDRKIISFFSFFIFIFLGLHCTIVSTSKFQLLRRMLSYFSYFPNNSTSTGYQFLL